MSNNSTITISVDSSEDAPLLDGRTASICRNSSISRQSWKSPSAREKLKDALTIRGLLVGLLIGVLICLSNVYFGLQTGFTNGMSLPASVLGYAVFKSVAQYLTHMLTPSENVFIETVAGAVGMIPLGSGILSVIPALEHLVTGDENGPIEISWIRLVLWSAGICFFGLIFAMPLRQQFVVHENLPFPSSTATALVIKTLHERSEMCTEDLNSPVDEEENDSVNQIINYPEGMRAMLFAFSGAGSFTLLSYFIPYLHRIPLFGQAASKDWLWSVDPSPGFIGQGVITGIAIPSHMLLGAIVGWGILSPVAKLKGWAPGDVGDWETGSRGWTVWISLAALLADCFVKLSWYALRLLNKYRAAIPESFSSLYRGKSSPRPLQYSEVAQDELDPDPDLDLDQRDRLHVTPSQEATESVPSLISFRVIRISLAGAAVFCILTTKLSFGSFMPIYTIVLAILLALVFSIMAVQAVGETDINPVGAIGKLSQFFFALLVPKSNPNAILINLIAGGITEAGAAQAGDLMFDLKTGHLLGVSPDALFFGQLIGSAFGAIVSAAFYKLYSSVYAVPGSLFQVPAAYVWVLTARLALGTGLPEKAWVFSVITAITFAVAAIIKIRYSDRRWQSLIPSGVAFSIGMYNVPSLAIARFAGGMIYWYWCLHLKREKSIIMLLASGLILGEALLSLLNLLLTATRIPHI